MPRCTGITCGLVPPALSLDGGGRVLARDANSHSVLHNAASSIEAVVASGCKWLQVVASGGSLDVRQTTSATCSSMRHIPICPTRRIGLAASRVGKCKKCRCCHPSDWRAVGAIGTIDTFGTFRTLGWIWHFLPCVRRPKSVSCRSPEHLPVCRLPTCRCHAGGWPTHAGSSSSSSPCSQFPSL